MSYRAPPPAGVRAWIETGLAAHRSGDLLRACDAYRQALALSPDQADALNLLGTALLQTGAAEDAFIYLQRAAAVSRNSPEILANLGQCAMALARHDVAYDAFRKASRMDPAAVHFQVGAASALALSGKLSDAESILRRLSKRHPRDAAVWFNLGHVMRDQRKRQDAIDCYETAVSLAPEMADAQNALGSALHSKLRFAEAEKRYREALRLAPDNLAARFNLASVLMDLGRFEESERAARELVAAAPESADARRLLGSALGFQTRLIDAQACFERAVQLDPSSAKGAETLAMSYAESGRTQQALRWFARAIELGAGAASVQPLRAGALLADGAIGDGWLDYRRRLEASLFKEKHPAIELTQSIIEAPEGKHVCILGEQGIGDEIFFLRYAKALADRGARLTYRGGAKIASLLARVPFLEQVIDESQPLPEADAYVLAGDLPHAVFAPGVEAIGTPLPAGPCIKELPRRIAVSYPLLPASIELTALPQRLSAMRERLAALGPPPYVGVTWRAGTLPEQQKATNWVLFKAVPLPALAAAVAEAPGTLLALQRAPHEHELADFASAAGRTMHDLCALNDDLEGMLALLTLIDEYVGVSNTNTHLRAAVGRTARVLVPAPAEWRWMRHAQSPWFPGFSIYRQALQGDWIRALRDLERDLRGTAPPMDVLTS